MEQDKKTDMRVVVFKDGDVWVAQGLEKDICAHGPNLKTVRSRFQVAADAENLDSIGPAPDYFQNMWDDVSPFSDAAFEEDDGFEMALCA